MAGRGLITHGFTYCALYTNIVVGMLAAKIGPHTRSYSGLYISVPKERHMFSECTHGIRKLWLHA